MNLNDFELRIYSQNGEDGIIRELIKHIPKLSKNNNLFFYLEIGSGNGSECNTRALRELWPNKSFHGIMLDGQYENEKIGLHREFVTAENLERLLSSEKYNIPKKFDLFSLDIDFNDYYILQEFLRLGYRPNIIVCEYNASHPPNVEKVVKYDITGSWDGTDYFGASLLSLSKLCEKFDYTLVACDSMGVNAFFVLNSSSLNNLIKNAGNVNALYKPPKYGRNKNGHPPDPKKREYINFNNDANGDLLINFDTKYGKIYLNKFDKFFVDVFSRNQYWDDDTLCVLRDKKFIPEGRNILEIGGHCGTSTIFYAKNVLSPNNKIFTFEPQKKMFEILNKNIEVNNLTERVQTFNCAFFCKTGTINMTTQDIDGPVTGNISTLEKNSLCINYGGISLGSQGETVNSIKLDDLLLKEVCGTFGDIGYIHCDAQGAESFIFSEGKEFIKKHRPVIFYEDIALHGNYLHNVIKSSYPEFIRNSEFNLKDYCVNELGGYYHILNFNNNRMDSLLLPMN